MLLIPTGRRTSISIAREATAPLDIRAALALSTRDRVQPDRRQHAAVRQLRLRRDDGVRDVVVDGGVLFLLDFELGAVGEGPVDDVGLLGGALDER